MWKNNVLEIQIKISNYPFWLFFSFFILWGFINAIVLYNFRGGRCNEGGAPTILSLSSPTALSSFSCFSRSFASISLHPYSYDNKLRPLIHLDEARINEKHWPATTNCSAVLRYPNKSMTAV